MLLAGYIKIDGQKYFVAWKNIKSSECYWAFSPYHKDDVLNAQMGVQITNEEILSPLELKRFFNENYVIEVLKRLKISGNVFMYQQSQIIENLIDTITFAKNYRFNKNDILLNMESRVNITVIQDFKGADNNITFNYSKEDEYYTKIEIHYAGIEIYMEQAPFVLSEKAFPLIEADRLYKKKILTKTIKDIDYSLLCDSLDMSWYKKDGVLMKDYQSIESVRDFELKIITPLVDEILKKQSLNQELIVSIDTETTGLNVYNLDKNNPDKDHVVAIPITWTEDAGYVIFTDMEHFNNVDNDYAVHRLAEIFENFKGEREISIWRKQSNSQSQIKEMQLFDASADADLCDSLDGCIQETVIIRRDCINLVGHNVMFDKRAFIDSGSYFYFNNDTMQMSFDLSSRLIKGSNKLKHLTRKIFGHETPELSDILGKGNEDKYRFLTNKEVANIYGCADADYTRKIYFYLRKLMSNSMYERYQALDVPMLNILPRSEYYGLVVDEEKAFALGDSTYEDIERLKHFAYEYVGIFINAYKQRSRLEAKRAAGIISEEEYHNAVQSLVVDSNVIYEFEFKPNELRKVLFDILKYPIKAYTEGAKPQPKLDKYAMKKLAEEKRPKESVDFNRLEHDILMSSADPAEYERLMSSGDEKSIRKAKKMVLIDADEFNKCRYPLALVLQKYAELNKEYTAYYKPMRETNMESKIFKSYSLARIETRRIQNAAQTMKGNLKALVQAYNDDYYLLDFDMSQVEYRIMLSLAGHMEMIERMKDPERDYHTETASLINAIPAHKVDKKTRKKAKSVSFGVPYGLGERTLCDNLFGDQTEENLFATRLLLAKWEKANKPIMEFLNSERDNALIAREMSNELRDFMDAWEKDENGEYLRTASGDKIPKSTGFIYDKYGFYRTFDLSKVEQGTEAIKRRATGKYTSEESKIRRPAGNFPIQCFAAELFRIILIRFYDRCEKEGINDKLIWHMLIHDELLCSVHKSLHPFYIYKLVKESCMVTMKGHTKYFVGINIGNTWGEVKDDAREAPVYFVDRVVKRWDAGEFGDGPFWFNDPWNELIKDERAKYVDDRIGEVIHQVQPNIDNEPINIPLIMERFENYTVRAYVDDYPYNSYDDSNLSSSDLKNPDIQDRLWVSRFESWALGHFPEGKAFIDYDGKPGVLRRGSIKADSVISDDLDLSMFFEDEDAIIESGSYWSFDASECNEAYDSDVIDESHIEDIFMYELAEDSASTSNIAEMLKVKHKYANFNVMYDQVMIVLPKKYAQSVKQYLNKYVSNSGKSVVFSFSDGGAERWLKLSEQINWPELDSYISNLIKFDIVQNKNIMYTPRFFKHVGNNLIITLRDKYKFGNCEAWLKEFESSDGYTIILKSPLGDMRKLFFKCCIDFEQLDKYVEKEV